MDADLDHADNTLAFVVKDAVTGALDFVIRFLIDVVAMIEKLPFFGRNTAASRLLLSEEEEAELKALIQQIEHVQGGATRVNIARFNELQARKSGDLSEFLLARYNGVPNADLVYPGQRIAIPDTLDSLRALVAAGRLHS